MGKTRFEREGGSVGIKMLQDEGIHYPKRAGRKNPSWIMRYAVTGINLCSANRRFCNTIEASHCKCPRPHV